MKKIIFILLCLLVGTTVTQAVNIQPRTALGFDPNLGDESQEYGKADQVLLVPLIQPGSLRLSPEDWVKGIHYYTTVRLGFPDIPFHYVVFPNGQVYQTSKVGDEASVKVEGVGEDTILVVYLADSHSVDFDEQAKSEIEELLLDIANRNHIKAENIQIGNLLFAIDLQQKTSRIEKRDIVSGWNESFKIFKKSVEANYNPQKKDYKLEVATVKVPEAAVKPGQTVIIELTVKNTGEYSIYGNDDSSLLISKADGRLSKFFLNGAWASQSQVELLQEPDVIRPGEQQTFQVKFNVPLYFGKQTESFVLKNSLGETMQGTEFDISLTVDKLNETVVEILSTETGYLNVRSGDSGSAEVISRVSPGERYIMKRSGQYGYVQIDLGEGEFGWVSQNHVRKIN